MRYLNVLLIAIIFIDSCNKDNCTDIPNSRYLFPALPDNHSTWSVRDVDRYFDLPESVANCVTTDTLIQSILDYPFLGIFFAQNTPQEGYNLVYSQFKGLHELETRANAGQCLLRLYKNIDPIGFNNNWDTLTIGNFILKGMEIEIIQGQYTNLKNLDSKDFNDLFIRTMEVYEIEKTSMDFYGFNSRSLPIIKVARMMFLRKYEPFVKLYNSDIRIFNLTETFGPVTITELESIHNIALEYLKIVKK